MVNAWANLFYTAQVAVEKDEIGKAELIRLFGRLHDATAEEDDIPAIERINQQFCERYGHVMISGEPGDQFRQEDD